MLTPSVAQAAWQEVALVLMRLSPTAPVDDPKALVSALRQQGLCTLDEAHALIDLQALVARLASEPDVPHLAGEGSRQVVTRAEQALERIERTAGATVTTAPLRSEYDRAAVPPPPRTASPPRDTGRSSMGTGAPGSTTAAPAPDTPSRVSTGRSSRFVLALVVVCLVAAGAAALLFSGVGRSDPMAEGIAAYEAGQRMVARLAFERALADDPSDARALVYLGRLSREEGDLPQARRLLEQAVQREPENALTHRELAAALLADGQPELARRFYVRSLELNPTDRLAQGFLACALHRLARVDEARRWADRAGPGDWSSCLSTPVPMPAPGMP